MTPADFSVFLFDRIPPTRQFEERLWEAADNLRANAKLKANEYAAPLLGLFFLRYATNRFNAITPQAAREFAATQNQRNSETIEEVYLGMSVESQSFKDFINQTVGGAAQPQANAPLLTSYEIEVPSDDVLRQFNARVEPLFDLIENLQTQIAQLRQMRDKLLPRLMSGQLAVNAEAVASPR
jgi:type I restriction-modification system DNA methylase subunit